MPGAIAEKLLDDVVANTEVAAFTSWFDISDMDEVTLYVQNAITLTPGVLIWSVQVSPQAASTLNVSSAGEIVQTLVNLLDPRDADGTAGDQAAITSVSTAVARTGHAHLPVGLQARSLRIGYSTVDAVGTTDATDFHTLNAWVVGKPYGRAGR